MLKYILLAAMLIKELSVSSQQPTIKAGERFPNYILRPIINAPVKEYDIAKENKKFLILNFWGTWCVPCIPEMDSLNRLQEKYKDKIHVVAISNETTDRLENYLKKRPSRLWLASDTSFFLYHQFNFNYVGQSAIVDRDNKIVALVRTDSINQKFIDKLIKGLPIKSSAETGIDNTKQVTDYFGVDSSISFSVTLCGARPNDYGSGTIGYKNTVFDGRRKTVFNVPETFLFNIAYDIYTFDQVVYLPDSKSFDKSRIVCFDILVTPEQKDSLNLIMQKELNNMLAVKARKEKRVIPVYVLKRKENDTTTWVPSIAYESYVIASGKGYNGKSVTLQQFADYITNELGGKPVVDETGLKEKYNIKTVNVIRAKEEILKNIDKLGLKIEEAEREMDMLIIYKE